MEKRHLGQKITAALSQGLLYLREEKIIFISSFLACIAACFHTILYKDIFEQLTAGFFLAAIASVPAVLFTKNTASLKKYLIQIAAACAGFALGFFSYRGFGNEVYGPMYFWGITCAAIVTGLFLFNSRADSRTYYAFLLRHFSFCTLMSLVLFGGLNLLIYAVQSLILNTSNYDIYSCCWNFIFFVFAVNTFLCKLFHSSSDEASGRAFKIIIVYIIFPVFAFLLAVLYIYLIKALIIFELPSGEINWFVSFASGTYLAMYMILREYDEIPAVRLFYRAGVFAMIPLILIQIWTFTIRVSAYGFTGWRWSSMLLIIFSAVAVALTLIKKGRFFNYSLLLLAVLILFGSVTPFNLIDMGYKSQVKRGVSILEKYGMYDRETDSRTAYDASQIENTISDEDRQELKACYIYLAYTTELDPPAWAVKKSDDPEKGELYGFTNVFGIREKKDDASLIRQDYSTTENGKIYDLSGFSRMEKLYIYKSSSSWVDGEWKDYANEYPAITLDTENGRYDLTAFLLDFKEESVKGNFVWYSPDKKTSFCFHRIYYRYNTDKKLFEHCSCEGFIFYR